MHTAPVLEADTVENRLLQRVQTASTGEDNQRVELQGRAEQDDKRAVTRPESGSWTPPRKRAQPGASTTAEPARRHRRADAPDVTERESPPTSANTRLQERPRGAGAKRRRARTGREHAAKRRRGRRAEPVEPEQASARWARESDRESTMTNAETGAGTAHENLDDQADPAVGTEPGNVDIDLQNASADAGAAGDIDTQTGVANAGAASDIDTQNGRAGDADPGERA